MTSLEMKKFLALNSISIEIDRTELELKQSLTTIKSKLDAISLTLSNCKSIIKYWNDGTNVIHSGIQYFQLPKRVFFPKGTTIKYNKKVYTKKEFQEYISSLKKERKNLDKNYSSVKKELDLIFNKVKTIDEKIDEKIEFYKKKLKELEDLKKESKDAV